jgi:ribose transport system permease protein
MASTPQIVSGGGGLDISVGPQMIFWNVIIVVVLLPNGIDTGWTAVPLILIGGAALGAINGILVAYLRFQPVVATLCMFFVLGGLNIKIAAETHRASNNWTTDLAHSVGPVPGALLLLAIPVVIWIALSKTRYHRALYSVGGNELTAFSSGVDVARVRVVAYALGGLIAAVGGIAITAVLQSSQGNVSAQYTLIALAAVALGGTSFGGGRGGLACSFLGAAAIYLIQTLLASLDVAPTWLSLVYGVMLVIGVVVGASLTRFRPATPKAVSQ